MRCTLLRRAAPWLLLGALIAAPTAHADVFTLKDGTTVDGKLTKQNDEFAWVRTVAGVRKLKVAEIESREPGKSAYETFSELKKKVAKAPKDAAAHWELYAFMAAQKEPSLAKDQAKLLAKVLKLDPEHADARAANGDVRFQNMWVKKADLERLEAEAAANKVRREWEEKLGLKIELYETEHFLLLDDTEEKDLPGRAQSLEDAHEKLAEVLGRERLWRDKMVVVTVAEFDDYTSVVDRFAKTWAMSAAWITAVKRKDMGGLWRERPYAMQVRWPASGDEGMWAAIIHNCAHVAVWKHWGNRKAPPTWLEEGLGVWVELQVTDDNLATCIGGSATKRGKTDVRKKKKKRKGKDSLRETTSEWKERCVEAVSGGEFPSLRKFLRMTQGDYGPAEEGGALGLVTWLMTLGQEKFRKLIAQMKVHSKDDPPWRDTYDDWQVIEDAEKEFFLWVQTDW